MKNININKRDLKFFFLGFLILFIVESIWSWPDTKKAFMKGYQSVDCQPVEKK